MKKLISTPEKIFYHSLLYGLLLFNLLIFFEVGIQFHDMSLFYAELFLSVTIAIWTRNIIKRKETPK